MNEVCPLFFFHQTLATKAPSSTTTTSWRPAFAWPRPASSKESIALILSNRLFCYVNKGASLLASQFRIFDNVFSAKRLNRFIWTLLAGYKIFVWYVLPFSVIIVLAENSEILNCMCLKKLKNLLQSTPRSNLNWLSNF